MWGLIVGLLILLAGVMLIGVMLIRTHAAERMRQRLKIDSDDDNPSETIRSPAGRLTQRWRWLAFLLGVVLLGLALLLAPWPMPYSLACGVMLTMVFWQLEQWWFQFRLNRVEQQMADSIDMMVSAVKAGASLQGALESMMENTRDPWKSELGNIVARIRYGDNPIDVFSDLRERIPLETARLFSQTLAVNWTVGGKLSLALANVARTIRDRLELSRRMQAMTTQARLSVISVVLVTYFIGALMWRNDPEGMGDYLSSLVGQGLVSIAIILQAIGIVWISRLSTPRF